MRVRPRGRGSIQQRGEGWAWRVDVAPGPDGKRNQMRRSGFRSYEEAELDLVAYHAANAGIPLVPVLVDLLQVELIRDALTRCSKEWGAEDLEAMAILLADLVKAEKALRIAEAAHVAT